MYQGWAKERDDGTIRNYTATTMRGEPRLFAPGADRTVTYGQIVCTQAARRVLGLHYCAKVLCMRCSYPDCTHRLMDLARGGTGRIPSVHYRWYKPLEAFAKWVQISQLVHEPKKFTMRRYLRSSPCGGTSTASSSPASCALMP